MAALSDIFHSDTVSWFTRTFPSPTAIQREAWPAIASGGHVLLSAPTGTGKTMAAFLWFIDQLKEEARSGAQPEAVSLIYVSPLKALGNDIRENLQKPLEGIGGTELRVGIRTGDTTAAQRRQMLEHPPHILITTPESLYLLLTSQKGRKFLSTARAIILDELHAIISGKRGTHLFLSLARLDALCAKPLQRIGLSATMQPIELAAKVLAPDCPVRIITPKSEKALSMQVRSVLPDMRILPNGTIWPELCRAVYEESIGKRTVIVFVEGRAMAEKLAYGINEIAGEGFALTHHGSMDKNRRLRAEEALRSGSLRILCATSSMELGIDVGEVDLVIQVGNPLTISAALQRLGRAGHNPGRTSVMHLYPRTAAETVSCGMTATAALSGSIEEIRPPKGCYDLLAQHLVSMAVETTYTVQFALDLIHHVYGMEDVTMEMLDNILQMLSGDYEHEQDHPARPRVLYDRIHGTVTGDSYSRMLALSSGGTIPDRGMYPVCLADGTRLGELDEEFIFEARVGDKFLLGAFAWRFAEIKKDRVIVQPTTPEGAQPPFWKGDTMGRAYETSLRFGGYLRGLQQAHKKDILSGLKALHLDEDAAENGARYLQNQLEATGCLPDDRTILLEHFADEAGEAQLMVHSIFGRKVNYALSLLLQHEVSKLTGKDIRVFEDDDGILLYSTGSKPFPEGLLFSIDPNFITEKLRALLPATSLFSMAFRYNAARALMMGCRQGKRLPLWVQRFRGAETLSGIVRKWDHPLMQETLRECLEDYLDIPALCKVLNDIRSGAIQVRELHSPSPSPMALPLRREVEATLLYDYHPIPAAAYAVSAEALKAQEALPPTADMLQAQSVRQKLPKNTDELHSLLLAEGDLTAGELDIPIEWLEELVKKEQALYIEPGLWICTEQREHYRKALEENEEAARLRIIRRCLRYRGGQDAESLSDRYLFSAEECKALLERLAEENIAVKEGEIYYHEQIYRRAQQGTIRARRAQADTQPPERYAALIVRQLRGLGSPEEQLRQALDRLSGEYYPLKAWEQLLLPARVRQYTPVLLDRLLAQGAYVWQIAQNKKELTFYPTERIDWDASFIEAETELDPEETLILRFLEQRGASFTQAMAPLIREKSIIEVLLSLAEKGLVRSDSFSPLRMGLPLEGKKNLTPKQTARLRASAQQSGRWERTRAVRKLTTEEALEQEFARKIILSRETVGSLPWHEALEVLRIQEYTGQVRRGYFIRGLSGAQFIREKIYLSTAAALANPGDEFLWMNAADPLQPWGKELALPEGVSLLRVPGSAVCLKGGRTVALIEHQGKTLKLFETEDADEILQALAREFMQGYLFPQQNRLTIQDYPQSCKSLLKETGFSQEMLDFVLWRK